MLENREDETVNMNLPAYSGKIDNTSAQPVSESPCTFRKITVCGRLQVYPVFAGQTLKALAGTCLFDKLIFRHPVLRSTLKRMVHDLFSGVDSAVCWRTGIFLQCGLLFLA